MSARPKKDDNEKKLELLPSWFETGIVTALLIPLLYTTGWSYAYHYFERFSLGLLGLNLPKEYLFVYSFQVIKDQGLWFLLTLLAFVFLLVFGRVLLEKMEVKAKSPTKGRMLNVVPAALLPLLLFSVFWTCYFLGERAAGNVYERQVQHDFDAYLRIQVWANAPEGEEYRDEMAKEWQKGCYRLLMHNNDRLFLFQPQKTGGKIPTDVIPAEKVELIRMLPVNTSCP